MIPRLQTEQELEDPYAADEEYLREVIAQASAPSPAPAPAAAPDWMSALQATKPGWMLQAQQTQPVSAETGELPGPIEQYLFYDPTQTDVGQQYQRYSPTGEFQGTGQFQEVGNALDLALQAGQDLGPFVQFIPGVGQVFQTINAVGALKSGNIAQGIGTLAGLGGYTDIANAARLVGAAQDKDPLAFLSAGMNLTGTKDIGGFTTKDITAANAVVQGLQTGNVAQALNGAAQLTDSPNVALAGAAVSMLDAAKSGNPAAMLKAGEALSGAINEQSRYYSKTDTGDETARLLARYGTADDALFKQIEAMAPRDTSVPPTQADVEEAIFQDVVRQSPEQQLAPAGTEVVQQAIQDDLNRDIADIVYLNADGEGIKTQQEAAQQASQRGLPGFIFQGQTYRLSQAPGYLSPEGKLYPSEAAYVATLGPKTITIPGIQIAAPKAPVASYSNEARIGLASKPAPVTAAPAAPAEQFVNPAVDFTEAATASQGNPLSVGYKPSTTPSDIVQNLRDVRQNIKQSTDTGGRLGLSQGTGTVARLAAIIGSGFGTAPENFAPATGEIDPLTAMQGEPLSPDAAVRDVQKELYDYQKSQLAALPNDAQRAFASGVASTVNTVASYALGGPFATVANAAANTGNLAWMQGKEAGLTPEDNAKRSAFMAGVEAVGELAGVPFLKVLFKEMPMTGSKDALTDWLATKLKAYGGEQLTENLTTAGQFAVDKFADFGIPSQATDFGKALGETIIATTAAFGGTGAVGTFYGTPGLRTVTTQAPPTPIEFLGSTPATQIVPTEGVPQQLTYQPPAPPPSQVQITGPEAAAPAPEIFGPESQLGFEEGVRPTAQQQLEEALSGVYEPPAAPAPAPSVPLDTTGITPEMVAFIDEEGNLVTYGDLGFTAPAPAPAAQPATQTAPQTQPATDAIFAEPQIDEINRLFQEVYQQQNYPVAAPTAAPTTALTAAPAQQDVIDLAPALTTAAPAQDLSAYQQAINQAVYGGTGEEPVTQAPAPSATPDTGTILSTDPTQGTALVVGPNGDTKVVDVSPDSKPGDTVNINAPSQDLSTPVATDPTTGEVIRLGDVTPSAPAPSTTETKTQAPAPSQAVVTTAAPSPAPSTTETKTEAPAPAAPSPAPAPTTTETKTQAPAPAPTTTEIKTEAPAPTTTETKTEAPAPAPTTTETKTEAPAPAPSTTETKTEAPAPAPTTTEIKTEAPAPTTTETKTEAPAPTTQAPTPAPPPSQPPSQPPAQPPSQPPAQPPSQPPAQPPAPAPTPAPTPPPPGEDVLPPVTEEELREIVSGPPPAPTPPAPPPPPAPTPAPSAPTPAPPAPTPAPPAPTVKPPVVKPPSPAPSPAAQLAQVPNMTPELANLVQELMRTDPANLLAFTMVLQEEQEEKLQGLRGKLKSRKA